MVRESDMTECVSTAGLAATIRAWLEDEFRELSMSSVKRGLRPLAITFGDSTSPQSFTFRGERWAGYAEVRLEEEPRISLHFDLPAEGRNADQARTTAMIAATFSDKDGPREQDARKERA